MLLKPGTGNRERESGNEQSAVFAIKERTTSQSGRKIWKVSYVFSDEQVEF